MKYASIVIIALLLFSFTSIKSFASPLTIKAFEQSPFNKTYTIKDKSSWPLKSGGTNYYYSYPDAENTYSSISVELGNKTDNIKDVGVSWYGESNISPAKLTKTKEAFLKKLIASTFPEAKAISVISYARSQQNKKYPGGSSTMPRRRFGTLSVYAGTNGETLIVGIEKK